MSDGDDKGGVFKLHTFAERMKQHANIVIRGALTIAVCGKERYLADGRRRIKAALMAAEQSISPNEKGTSE